MKDRCGWCTNGKGKTSLEFSVIDEDFGQHVPGSLINFCPFCGRGINNEKQKEPEWKSRVLRTFLGEEA